MTWELRQGDAPLLEYGDGRLTWQRRREYNQAGGDDDD